MPGEGRLYEKGGDFQSMTPDKLALAFSRLHGTLVQSQAAAVLEPLRPFATRPKPDLQALLHVFTALVSGQAQFGEAERSLLAAFGLHPVVDTAWWAALITACTRSTMNHEAAAMIERIHSRLQIATETFPALARLLNEPATNQPVEQGGVVLLVPGVDGAPPVLARVATVIDALGQLWTVAEDLTGQRGALRLTGMEPGPTLAIHFDGLSEPLLELHLLLVSIWDQTARLARVPPEQHPAMVPEMLPVMQRIGQSGRADALRVRSAVESGVRRLLEAGCTLPSDPRMAEPPVAEYRTAAVPNTAAPPSWGKPPEAAGPTEDDLSHLAAVIAQERSQLKQVEPGRRLWQGTTASHPA